MLKVSLTKVLLSFTGFPLELAISAAPAANGLFTTVATAGSCLRPTGHGGGILGTECLTWTGFGSKGCQTRTPSLDPSHTKLKEAVLLVCVVVEEVAS